MNASFFLIISCFAVYGIISFAIAGGASSDAILNDFAFSGANAFSKPWTFLTCAFLHADIAHLLSNMLVLLFFGTSVENELGKGKMIMIFFLGVLAGDVFSLFFYQPNVLLLGASAGIFALIGAGMLVRPVDLSFYPFIVPMPLGVIGIIYIVYNSLGFFAGDSGVSYIAHAGGMLVGLAFGFRQEGFKKGMLTVLLMLLLALLLPIAFSILFSMLS